MATGTIASMVSTTIWMASSTATTTDVQTPPSVPTTEAAAVRAAALATVTTRYQPPVADAGSGMLGCPNRDVTLDSTDSYDPDSTIVFYDWDSGQNGPTPSVRVSGTEGNSTVYELVLASVHGAESFPDDVTVITNTSPRFQGASARGDCAQLRLCPTAIGLPAIGLPAIGLTARSGRPVAVVRLGR